MLKIRRYVVGIFATVLSTAISLPGGSYIAKSNVSEKLIVEVEVDIGKNTTEAEPYTLKSADYVQVAAIGDQREDDTIKYSSINSPTEDVNKYNATQAVQSPASLLPFNTEHNLNSSANHTAKSVSVLSTNFNQPKYFRNPPMSSLKKTSANTSARRDHDDHTNTIVGSPSRSSSEDWFSVMIHDLHNKCCPLEELLLWNLDYDEPQCAPKPSNMTFSQTVALPQLNITRLQHRPISCEVRRHLWLHDQEVMKLDPNGMLSLTGHSWPLRAEKMCVDALWTETSTYSMTVSARVCDRKQPQPLVSRLELKARCSDEEVFCLRTCCPPGMKTVGDPGGEFSCERSELKEREWASWVHRDSIELDNMRVVAGNPRCPYKLPPDDAFTLWPNSNPNDWFQIGSNGSMIIPELLNPIPPDQYCLDLAQRNYFSPNEIRAFVCYQNYPDEWIYGYFGFLYNLVAHTITCFFLGATVGFYVWLPQLRNFHGACQMCYVITYLAIYVLTFIMLLDFVRMSEVMCHLVGFIFYYLYFCNRFWLNVICYDIYRTFSRAKAAPSVRSLHTRFVRFSLFAWGMPTVLTGFTLFMHLVPYDVIHPLSFHRPFSSSFCLIIEPPKRLIYVDGPVAVLMSIDMVFLVLTIYSILKTDRQTRLVASHKRKLDRLQLFGRLVLITGVVWLVQSVAYQIEPFGNIYFWIPLEIFATLQGIVVFLLFTCRRSSRRIIAQRLSTTSLGVAWNYFTIKLNQLSCNCLRPRSRRTHSQQLRTCELNNPYQTTAADNTAPVAHSLNVHISTFTEVSMCTLPSQPTETDSPKSNENPTHLPDATGKRPKEHQFSASPSNYCTKL